MKELEERILQEGKVLPGGVLKVASFFNVNIDTSLTMNMGREIARLFDGSEITKVLTVETSGIPLALAAANFVGVPLVFAKKNPSSNIDGEMLEEKVHSYTHGNDNFIVVPREYISKDDKILIVDDFLAVGNALRGLCSLVSQAGAAMVGCAVGIEKGFQHGGDVIRQSGIRVESLAVIDSMDGGEIIFR